MNIFIPIFINISTFIYSESSQQYFPSQSDIKIIVRYLLLPYSTVWNLASITRDQFPFLSVLPSRENVTILPSRPPPSAQSGRHPLYSTWAHPPRARPHPPAWAPSARLGPLQFPLLLPHAVPAYIDSPHAKNSALHCSDWWEEKRERRMRKNPLPSIFKILYMLRILFYLWYILQIFSRVSVVYLNL